MSNSAVWVECMSVLFGLAMVMGDAASCLLTTGRLGATKCAVQPESAMSVVVVVGGPERILHDRQWALTVFSLLSRFSCSGFPRPYSWASSSFFLCMPGSFVLPPMRLKMVAFALCPSARFSHVALVCLGFLVTPCVQQYPPVPSAKRVFCALGGVPVVELVLLCAAAAVSVLGVTTAAFAPL
jgi:hypothetical protein